MILWQNHNIFNDPRHTQNDPRHLIFDILGIWNMKINLNSSDRQIVRWMVNFLTLRARTYLILHMTLIFVCVHTHIYI